VKHPVPNAEGFWWACWQFQYDSKEKERGEETYEPSHEYEIVHVVDNNGEGDEKYMAMVPGVVNWQPLQDFIWGEFVSNNRPITKE
jgi:antirestriction protein